MSKDYDALEEKYLALCKDIQAQANKIVGVAGNGRSQEAALLASLLVNTVKQAKQSYLMQQEQATGYDLNALHVNPSDTRRE